MKVKQNFKVLAIENYLPNLKQHSSDLDRLFGFEEGHIQKKTGVEYRYVSENETAIEMAAKACHKTLDAAGVGIDDVDVLLFASCSKAHMIPYNASSVLQLMKPQKKSIQTFDVNSTCLSFYTAMDLAQMYLGNPNIKKVLVVTSELVSPFRNPHEWESAGLIGDASVACLFGKKDQSEATYASYFETHPEGNTYCLVEGLGSSRHPHGPLEVEGQDIYFKMAGKEVFKFTVKKLKGFMDIFFKDASLTLEDIDCVVPHQASGPGIDLCSKILNLNEIKMVNIIKEFGNNAAASTPLALCQGIKSGIIKRGERIVFLGTAAGLSIGAISFRY